MFSVEQKYMPHHELAKKLLPKTETFAEGMEHVLWLHAQVHASDVSDTLVPTYADEIYQNITDAQLRMAPIARVFPIVWQIWHSTRIEDIVSNLLIKEQPQIYDDSWHTRLNSTVIDTGNAMMKKAVTLFSQAINSEALQEYKQAVGHNTRAILRGLTSKEMKRKPSPQALQQIMEQGGLTEEKNSLWLRDFWGSKTFAGLLLLPLTRHHIMHLDKCRKIREKLGIKN